MQHELHDILRKINDDIAAQYARISRRAAQDPGSAGDQGEENWAAIMREWLPQYYHVTTKGQIINEKGELSPQLDVVVLKPEYPKALLNTKMYLSTGVAAAFECKLTLTKDDIFKTMKNSLVVKALYPPQIGTPEDEMKSPIIYGLLAHSHRWKGARKVISGHMLGNMDPTAHPRGLIDLVCVANVATWALRKQIVYYAQKNSVAGHALYVQVDRPPDAAPQKPYNAEFPACGPLIMQLLSRMSQYNPAIGDISRYFHRSEYPAQAGDAIERALSPNIFSEVAKSILRRQVPSGKTSVLQTFF